MSAPGRRSPKPASRTLTDPHEAAPWTIEFANTPLSEENWKAHLENWFGISLNAREEDTADEDGSGAVGKKSLQLHYGGMAPTLAHIHRAQESVRETLGTLAEKGTVPRDAVARVNSYLMGLHGLKFHITADLALDGPPNGPGTGEEASNSEGGDADSAAGRKGVQPQTLRLEPKTFDLRSLFYYRFSLFLISPAARRVRRCKQCGAFFIQRFNHRKLYCSDLCRFRSHNRTRAGKRGSDRRRPPAGPSQEGNPVWWRKYDEKTPPD
ncbi:MAG: hypothetical protein ACE5IM_03170 [Nitrospinota bacterium]